MIDRQALLTDLQPLVVELVEDLRTRLAEHPASKALVDGDYDAARRAGRTAQTLAAFAEDHLTQVAVAWVLATVFVRFVEDNQLCDEPWFSGPGKRLAQARDRYTTWLRNNSKLSDREYLLHAFGALGKLPGLAPLLGPQNTLLHRIGPSADGARTLREFWQQIEGQGDASNLTHDFTDPAADTRFLGDLYQDLSESAKDKFALLQTPIFVEEFILDRTLEPALAEFGLAEVRLIDPACGSGHFLLGAFARLFQRWSDREPGTPVQERCKRALDAVAGVDLNPFAVAIARFRLLVAALKACDVRRLAEAYDFRPKVANGDSLLHGQQGLRQRSFSAEEEAEFDHFYGSEDKALLKSISARSYHAVVGNPPYIVARDKALNALYRKRFPEVCHRQYSLAVPFTQVFFELARPSLDEKRGAGFVGVITANSFMKREFGSKLIEDYLNRRVEVSHVIDLSDASIPDHNTPTAVLLGRARPPTSQSIRAVRGIKGEQGIPDDPTRGLVWLSVLDQVDKPGTQNEYTSCSDVPREQFARHPWSIGGGGATELKAQIEEVCEKTLTSLSEAPIGRAVRIAEEEVFMFPGNRRRYSKAPEREFRGFLVGESLRDWGSSIDTWVWYPYEEGADASPMLRELWPWRTSLANRSTFQGKMADAGLRWFDYMQHTASAYCTPLSIAFAEVATHNHFVLDRGGKVFKQTAPVIKLPAGATEDEHIGLLGLLNSSVACFWLRQVCHNKGLRGQSGGITSEKWEQFFQFSATALGEFPVAELRPAIRARPLDALGSQLASEVTTTSGAEHSKTLAHLIALQEEIDWECYRHYGILKDDLTFPTADVPPLQLGQRAFEVVLARQLAAGKTTTTWFERHGSTPITEVPAQWPKPYRDLVQRRIDCIEKNADIRLIEQPEYKRRWNVEPFAEQLHRAQRSWLLDRMEDPRFWPEPRLVSTARFAEQLRRDADFKRVADLYRGRDDYDFDDLVRELVESEAVPFLPVLRYKLSGLRKLADWEATWALQRREDAGEKLKDPIPVPPKYTSADFLKSTWWSLRGKLDVPKERFLLYPFAERGDDPTPVFTWAGFDQQQQAHALTARYQDRKHQDAATPDQLFPLLTGLRELLPWLLQWHNIPTTEAPSGLGTEYQRFLASELLALDKTEKDLTDWTPPARPRGRRAARRGNRPDANEVAD
ncbi:MAG: BREX-2 system adenine-specific DNA-methyltransferase PglX [Planctomycetota bacterium]